MLLRIVILFRQSSKYSLAEFSQIESDLWVARFFCDRIAVMNQGKIVEIGTTEQIFNQPQNSYTQKLLNAAPLLAKSPTIDN